MDFTAIFGAVRESPTGALLVMALMALAWIVRDGRQRDDAHAAQIRAQHEAHLQTAMQVAPLASKLVDCVSLLERMVTTRGGPS